MKEIMEKIKIIILTHKALCTVVVLALITPSLTDLIVRIPIKSVADQSSWIGFFGNYFGAIVGGFVAYFVARYQIENESIKEKAKNNQKLIEERLNKLYKPVYTLITNFYRNYGPHTFHSLAQSDQDKFINLLVDNIAYADADLDITIMEMTWTLQGTRSQFENKKAIDIQYRFINDLITSSYHNFRKQLGLPDISFENAIHADRNKLYVELEKKYFPHGYSSDES